LARFPGTWWIFFSPTDSKLTRDCLGLYWNGQRKNIGTCGFDLVGRNIAPLHFKTDRVAETALSPSWFWPTVARFPATWWIFLSPRDSKLTRDGLSFQWNGERKKYLNACLRAPRANIAPLHVKTDRVAETALGASWFLLTLAQFPGT